MDIINSIRNYLSGFSVETHRVQTEEELLTKVEEVTQRALKDQKIELNIQSIRNPNFSHTVKFGFREDDSFKERDLKVKILIGQQEKGKASKVFYDIQEHVVTEVKDAYSVKRQAESSTRYELEGSEKSLLADPSQLSERGSVEFYKIAQKYPIGSQERLLSDEASERIQSLVSGKLRELSPLVAPKTIPQELASRFLAVFGY